MYKKYKTLTAFIIAGALLTGSLQGALASSEAEPYSEKTDAQNITRDFVYTTSEEGADPKNFTDPDIEENGVIYELYSIDNLQLINKKEIKPNTIVYSSQVFKGDSESYSPEETITYEDGKDYRLISSKLIEITSEEMTEYMETVITYTDIEAGVMIPDATDYEYTDTDLDYTTTSEFELIKQEITRKLWTDNFEFGITIAGYGADTIEFAGTEIPGDADLEDYAYEILEYLGLDPDYYRIDDISWDGAAYEYDGETRRDAIATGSKLVIDIDATYGGYITIPSVNGRMWECTYEEILEGDNYEYTYSAEAIYAKKEIPDTESEDIAKGLLSIMADALLGAIKAIYEPITAMIKEHPAASGTFAVIFTAMLAFLLTRQRKKKCIYNKKITCRRNRNCEGCEFEKKQ